MTLLYDYCVWKCNMCRPGPCVSFCFSCWYTRNIQEGYKPPLLMHDPVDMSCQIQMCSAIFVPMILWSVFMFLYWTHEIKVLDLLLNVSMCFYVFWGEPVIGHSGQTMLAVVASSRSELIFIFLAPEYTVSLRRMNNLFILDSSLNTCLQKRGKRG